LKFETPLIPAYDPFVGAVSEGQGPWESLSTELSAPSLGWHRIRMPYRYCGTHEHGIPKTRHEQPERISAAFRVRIADASFR
jgi:hypothetical protein